MHAIELAIDDPDANAERAELGSKREPGRSRADDEDVRFAVNRHRTRIFPTRAVTRLELAQVARGSAPPLRGVGARGHRWNRAGPAAAAARVEEHADFPEREAVLLAQLRRQHRQADGDR